MIASPYFFVFISSMTVSRMKLDGRGSEGELVSDSSDFDDDKFAVFMFFLFYMVWMSRGWFGEGNAGRFRVGAIV
jgi:hypothetical protein